MSKSDYSVEYAKSSRSTCRLTKQPIPKGALRIAEIVRATNFDGFNYLWCNFDDFKKDPKVVAEFKLKCQNLKNLDKIRPKDQQEVLALLGKQDDKVENDEEKALNKAFTEEQNAIWALTDELKSLCSSSALKSYLQFNDQYAVGGFDDLVTRVAKGMYFGKLPRCQNPECISNSYLVYCEGAYVKCIGKTQWAKCDVHLPLSKIQVEPWKFQAKTCPIKNWKFVKHEKVDYKKNKVQNELSEEEKKKLEQIIDFVEPFSGMTIGFRGTFPDYSLKDLKHMILKHGGKTGSLSKCTHIVVDEESRNSDAITKAINKDINIVKLDFILKSIEKTSRLTEEEIKNDDLMYHVSATKGILKRKRESEQTIEVSPAKKRKIQIKGRAAVDEDCEIADEVHVYDDGQKVWSCHLALTDVVNGVNSYYVLQVLQDDNNPNLVYLFRKWGRTGTTIGGNKCDEYIDLQNAKWEFETIYEEKTGNSFNDINFTKRPGLFHPIKVTYGDKLSFDLSSYTGKLSKAVADLISLIFDVKVLEASMMEMEIDTESLPLGNISAQAIDTGFQVLSEIEAAIQQNASNSELVKLSNKFYMIVPQTNTPLINSTDLLKEKSELLGSLRDMAVAVSFMKDTRENTSLHPIDSFYNQLKNEIIHVDPESEEFKLCRDYLLNTHAPTHSSYTLELEEVFKVTREGEDESFSKWKDTPNHRLLWHGSRLSNWTGILSQGLRIAPPNAPVSGYMFGKAVYFANMSSKSANYCRVSPENNTGLLMLCQVPLGRIKKVCHADYHTPERLQRESFDSLWGQGKTIPNKVSHTKVTMDGVEVIVPKGEPKTKNISSSLLYDEFTVYDETQLRSRYLLRVKFNFKNNRWY